MLPRRLLAVLLLGIALFPARAFASGPDGSVATTWRLLDYIAVDYREAVADGEVINQLEYDEMLEFSETAANAIAALPPTPSRTRRLLISKSGTSSGLASSGSGASSGWRVQFFPRFLGHTTWHVSQPYRRLPIFRLYSSGTMSLVWVRKEMHFRAFRSPGPSSAPVGQASMQSVQSPH